MRIELATPPSMPRCEALRIGDEEVVADELHPVAELAASALPGLPVVLGRAVLDRDDRVALDELGPEPGELVRAERRGPRSGRRRRDRPRWSPGRARSRSRRGAPRASAASRIASIAASLEARSGAKPPSSPTAVASPRSCEDASSAW